MIEDRKSERDVEFNNGHRGDHRERRPGRASPRLRSKQRGDPADQERDQESGRNADRGLGKQIGVAEADICGRYAQRGIYRGRRQVQHHEERQADGGERRASRARKLG